MNRCEECIKEGYERSICALCRQSTRRDSIYALQKCNHIFHTSCLVNAIKLPCSHCPVCSTRISWKTMWSWEAHKTCFMNLEEGDKCTVCEKAYVIGDVLIKLNCGNYYHQECCEKLFKHASECSTNSTNYFEVSECPGCKTEHPWRSGIQIYLMKKLEGMKEFIPED